jgi:CAAX protease family protein
MKIVKSQKIKLFLEILLVASVFLLIRGTMGTIKYSGQIAEVISLVLITYFLQRRNTSWKDLGFQLPKKKLIAILYFILCVVTIALVFNFIIQPLFPHGANDINQGDPISLNEMLFQLIIVGIGAAAIGEEMLMRGFVLNNLNEIFGKNFIGTAAAVLLQALLFAILHSGVQGMISAGVIGLILGIFYIVSGRNLLVVMAAHSVPDIISIVSSYQNQ